MTHIRENNVVFVVTSPVQLDDDPTVTLAPGRYPGISKQLGVPMMGGQINWMAPEYKLPLTKAQLETLGVGGNYTSIEYDISGHVRRSQIAVE